MKNQGGDLEVDSVFGEIGLPLELIPLESHNKCNQRIAGTFHYER